MTQWLLPAAVVAGSVVLSTAAGASAQEPADEPTPEPVPLAGLVFEDVDGNGRRDEGEAGLPDWTVEFRSHDEDGQSASDTTGPDDDRTDYDEAGRYFVDVPLRGSYLVCLAAMDGWLQTFPPGDAACHTIRPTTDRVERIDFGVWRALPTTVTANATAVVRLILDPPDNTFVAEFDGTPNGSIDHGADLEEIVEPGAHETRLSDVPDGYKLEAIDCDDGASASHSSGKVETATAVFALEPNETATCTFRLTRADKQRQETPAPRPGTWRAVNAKGALSCGGFAQELPKTTAKGQLEVKPGGRQLVVTGIADGRESSIVFKHDDKNPGTWKGKITVKQQGVTMTLRYVLEMVNEERLKGSMSARFKASGQSCELSRNLMLTYAGK